jgi:uncharacterized protein (DUF433 family)
MERKRTPAITRDPETHSGAPVSTGTRIAMKLLFDYLEDGQSVDDFVKHYPSVSRHDGACGGACARPVARLERSPSRVRWAIPGRRRASTRD